MANEVEIVVTGSDRTGNLFGRIRDNIRTHLRKSVDDANESGRSVGQRLMSSMGDSIRDGSKFVTDSLNSVFTGSLKGALSTPIMGPVIIAALGAAVAVAAPALAAVIGGALVLGFGAAFVGLGVMLLAQNEKIKAEFAKTWADVKNILTKAFEPLKPVLDVVRSTLLSLAKEFAPVIKAAAELAQGPLISFVKNLGQAFGNLAPAIRPMMQAFVDLLNLIGPQLPALFAQIGQAIGDIGRVVSENKTVIASMFMALLKTVPMVINAIGGLISFFGELVSVTLGVGSSIVGVFANISGVVLGFVSRFLGALKEIALAISNIPGLESIGKKMAAGLDIAIKKVDEWNRSAQSMAKEIQIKANIAQLQQAIDKARAQLNDPNLTKERRAQINADISKLEVAKARAIAELGDQRLIKTYTSKLDSDISALNSKLATARKELADPNLTRERRAKLNADIAQLLAAKARAQAAIDALHGKTVTITTLHYTKEILLAKNKATGGIVGAAGGGPRSNMTLVGEQGPELVRLPFGSSVIPAGQSRNMMSNGMSQEPVVVNVYVQGSIRSDRDLVALIRDEFLNGGFRGALNQS